MKLIPVALDEIPNMRESHRGRVSYPILKTFLESGEVCVQLDRTGMQQSFQALYSSLGAYARNHELPIKLFSRGGQIYLLRLDLDDNGKKIEDWKPDKVDQDKIDSAISIDDVEVAKRFEEEKDKVTK